VSGVWRGLLDWLLGRRRPPAPPPPLPPSPARRTRDVVDSAIKIEYQGALQPGTGAPTSMRWQREAYAGPKLRVGAWARRGTPRQRVLVVLALISIAAMSIVFGGRLFANRVLPPEVRGVWSTDAPAYAGRLFELRRGRVAFLSADSLQPVAVHLIRRVRERRDRDGTLYDVDLLRNGQVARFSFVYSAGPPEEIRLAHQRAYTWQRSTRVQTLMSPDL